MPMNWRTIDGVRNAFFEDAQVKLAAEAWVNHDGELERRHKYPEAYYHETWGPKEGGARFFVVEEDEGQGADDDEHAYDEADGGQWFAKVNNTLYEGDCRGQREGRCNQNGLDFYVFLGVFSDLSTCFFDEVVWAVQDADEDEAQTAGDWEGREDFEHAVALGPHHWAIKGEARDGTSNCNAHDEGDKKAREHEDDFPELFIFGFVEPSFKGYRPNHDEYEQ